MDNLWFDILLRSIFRLLEFNVLPHYMCIIDCAPSSRSRARTCLLRCDAEVDLPELLVALQILQEQ